jgi:hypothetical protein
MLTFVVNYFYQIESKMIMVFWFLQQPFDIKLHNIGSKGSLLFFQVFSSMTFAMFFDPFTTINRHCSNGP